MLADVVESLMGAIFLDGGWGKLFSVFGRIMLPFIVYSCKYSERIGTDLIHDITAYFAKQGNSYKIVVF
jgi:dsRNA-specific ribonuclease